MIKPQTIFRVVKSPDCPFVMLDKRILSVKQMSWKAKGILAYLLSKPDNWKINITDLVNQSTDKEYAVRSAVKELINLRYIKRFINRDGAGKITGWEYEVYESPYLELKPLRGFQDVDNQDVENRDINNNDINNKELTNILSGEPIAKGEEKQSEEKQSKSELLAETEAELKLFKELTAERRAKYGAKARATKHFTSKACKDKFKVASDRLTPEQMDQAIKRAMQKGLISVVEAVDFIACWNNSPQRQSYQVRSAKALTPEEADAEYLRLNAHLISQEM